MKSKLLAACAVVACVWAGSMRAARERPAPEPAEVVLRKDQMAGFVATPAVVPAPKLSVMVDPDLALDGDSAELYREMAALLDGSEALPDDRARYYAAHIGNKADTIHGWGAWVEDVRPADGGHLVTIRIVPAISSDRGGAVTILCGPNYSERYRVADGRATFVDSLDPDGSAGRDFPMIGL